MPEFPLKRWLENPSSRFIITFLGLFLIFYCFNIFYMGITAPGNFYSPFLADNLNYIQWLRTLLLSVSSGILEWLGYQTLTTEYTLHIAGRGGIRLVYSCLGYGVMSFFAAFVLAYPKPLKSKLFFLIFGLILIQALNISRFILIALYWRDLPFLGAVDHHTLFNIILYLILIAVLYFWVNAAPNTVAVASGSGSHSSSSNS